MVNPGAKRPPPTMETRKKRVSSGQFRTSAPRRDRGDRDPCFHRSSSVPELASVVQLSGMLWHCGEMNLQERELRRIPKAGENLPTDKT